MMIIVSYDADLVESWMKEEERILHTRESKYMQLYVCYKKSVINATRHLHNNSI